MKRTSAFSQSSEIKWVEKISRLMDSQFKIPGTNFKFGLDPIIGFIPFAGDASTFAISSALILYMIKNGASRKVIILMILNLVIDTIIGGIPIIGVIFDAYYKANNRNIRLLKRHYEEGKYQGSGKGLLIGVAIFLLLLFIGIVILFWELARYLVDLL